jgi:glycosyltransferase involved in cell wall biosynthesis
MAGTPALRPKVRTLLCVDHAPAIGGQTRVLLTALAALDMSRFRALVACNPGPVADEVRAQGHEVAPIALPMLTFAGGLRGLARSARAYLRASRALAHVAREHAPVAIWAHALTSALYAALPARLARVPLVWHVHEMYDARARMVPFVRLAAAAARVIVCPSRASAERTASLGAPAGKCRVVHNALPTALSGGASGSPDLAPELPDRPFVVAVGSITPGKGHRVLVEAMADIVRLHPRATAVIVGEPLLASDRQYAEDLQRDIDRLGLAQRVRLLGFRQDAAAILARADVVVHPSTCDDTFPLVPLEAMAAGRPVVASRVGGIPEIVSDGETGVLVAPGDPSALSNAVAGLLSDPERRERMGAAGRRSSAERFSVHRMLAGLNDAFTKAAGIAPFLMEEAASRATPTRRLPFTR